MDLDLLGEFGFCTERKETSNISLQPEYANETNEKTLENKMQAQ